MKSIIPTFTVAALGCVSVSGAVAKPTTAEGPVFEKALTDGRRIVVRREEFVYEGVSAKERAEQEKAGLYTVVPDHAYLYHFVLASENGKDERHLYARRAFMVRGDRFSTGELKVLDAVITAEGALVIVYREPAGASIEAIVPADSGKPPAVARIDDLLLAFSDGSGASILRAKVEALPEGGGVAVTVVRGGGNSQMRLIRYRLAKTDDAYKWEKGEELPWPTTRPAETGR